MKALGALALAVAAFACTNQESASVGSHDITASAEGRSLGIDHFQIDETVTRLTIAGVSKTGEQVGRVELTVGGFVMADDDRGQVFGRQMTMEVRGNRITHESQGLLALDLPPVDDEAIASFVADPAVSEALWRWNIVIELSERTPPANESPYDLDCYLSFGLSDNYDYGGSGSQGCPTSGTFSPPCGYSSCVLSTDAGEKTQFVCCSSNSTSVRRACTAPNSATSCGMAGPLGCAVCYTSGYQHYCGTRGGAQAGVHYCN